MNFRWIGVLISCLWYSQVGEFEKWTKMYQDLKRLLLWPEMKKDIAEFVYACLVCQKSKIQHQKSSGLMQPLCIPEWKWDVSLWILLGHCLRPWRDLIQFGWLSIGWQSRLILFLLRRVCLWWGWQRSTLSRLSDCIVFLRALCQTGIRGLLLCFGKVCKRLWELSWGWVLLIILRLMVKREDCSVFGRFVEGVCFGARCQLGRMFTVDWVYLQQQFSF